MCFNARFLNTGFALGFEPFLNFKFVICVKNNEDRLGFIWIRDNFFSIFEKFLILDTVGDPLYSKFSRVEK